MARDLDSAAVEYKRLKELVKSGRYPPYGRIIWNGDVCQVEFKVKFRVSTDEPLDRVRRRATEFLTWLEARQLWRWAEIDIPTSAGFPDYALIRVRSELMEMFRFGTSLLKEIQHFTRNP